TTPEPGEGAGRGGEDGVGTGNGPAGDGPASGRPGGDGTGAGAPGGGGTGGGEVARAGGGGGGAAPGNEDRFLNCTVVVDVRGLGPFQRDMTSFVYDESGTQLWPDAALVRGVSSQLVQEGSLQTYVTSEAEVAAFKNVTRVKAARVQPPRIAPNSQVFTDAVLGSAAAAQFRSAGAACRVVYLKS
uniref:hypothetical protein n=1 Tax=Deinococcus planocerae TaxID=1737569 RepID=UPI001CA53A97